MADKEKILGYIFIAPNRRIRCMAPALCKNRACAEELLAKSSVLVTTQKLDGETDATFCSRLSKLTRTLRATKRLP